MKNENLTVFVANVPDLGFRVYDNRKAFEHDVREAMGCYPEEKTWSIAAAYSKAKAQINSSKCLEVFLPECSNQELELIRSRGQNLCDEKGLAVIALLNIERSARSAGRFKNFTFIDKFLRSSGSGTWLEGIAKQHAEFSELVKDKMVGDKKCQISALPVAQGQELCSIFINSYSPGETMVVYESADSCHTIKRLTMDIETPSAIVDLYMNGLKVHRSIVDGRKVEDVNLKVEKGDHLSVMLIPCESSAKNTGITIEFVRQFD